MKKVILLTIAGLSFGLMAGVVSIDRPELALKGVTIAQLEKAKFTATRVGSYFTPGELKSTRVRKVKSIYGGEALHVEMQCLDAGEVKCLTLELTDGKDGVNAWVISSTYLHEADGHQLGEAFEKENGTFAGRMVKAVRSPKEPGYGLSDLKFTK